MLNQYQFCGCPGNTNEEFGPLSSAFFNRTCGGMLFELCSCSLLWFTVAAHASIASHL
jgi:hypothetical protein